MWNDFKSRFQHLLDDLKRQKDIVEGHANLSHIQNYESDRLKMLEEFNQARMKRVTEKKTFVLEWIGAPRSILDHESLCAVRQEEYEYTKTWTGRWILSHEDVQNWLATSVPKTSILWITAMPGAGTCSQTSCGGQEPSFTVYQTSDRGNLGKSVLASVVIDEIKDKHSEPIGFFYCKHGDPSRSTFVSVVKAFLSQLLVQQDHLLPYYYDESTASGEVNLHSSKLCKLLLRSMLQNIPRAFLIIDGLDECDPQERKLILDFFNEIINLCDSTTPGKVRLLIFGRDEVDIKKALSLGTVVRITPQDTIQDISNYIRHRAGVVQQKFSRYLTEEDRVYIEQNVLDRSDGTSIDWP
jgi:hypothetical protein